jgi:type III pantothenate kinase
MQFTSLNLNTAALPMVALPQTLPDRWALNTKDAIESGISRVVVDGLREYVNDWLAKFPSSRIILTGGDADVLRQWGLHHHTIDMHLIIHGLWMTHYHQQATKS